MKMKTCEKKMYMWLIMNDNNRGGATRQRWPCFDIHGIASSVSTPTLQVKTAALSEGLVKLKARSPYNSCHKATSKNYLLNIFQQIGALKRHRPSRVTYIAHFCFWVPLTHFSLGPNHLKRLSRHVPINEDYLR